MKLLAIDVRNMSLVDPTPKFGWLAKEEILERPQSAEDNHTNDFIRRRDSEKFGTYLI